jgi:AcrR family transcriptional regulator
MSKSTKDQHTARKAPRQERAQVSLDSIIEACKRILERKGYSHLTTNHIAEVAGVSVGTLYQYFPNKETIVYALIEDTVSKAAVVLRAKLLSIISEPVEVIMPQMIHLILKVHREEEFVLLHLSDQVPQIEGLGLELSTSNFTFSSNTAYLRQHRAEFSVDELELALFLMDNTIMSNCKSYLTKGFSDITDDQFVEQLSNMVVKYLTK